MEPMDIDLQFDATNLYVEESFTDLKVGAIRRLSPVTADGTPDPGRAPVFVAQTQLMSPNGPVPVNCTIEAATLTEAIEKFPGAIQEEVQRIVQLAQKARQDEASRIIVPGNPISG